jgi:adenosylcobinamide-GDP ribazoletransferase
MASGASGTVRVEHPLSLAALTGAVRQLTLLGTAPATDRPGRSLLWYPLVGLLLGSLWLAIDLIVGPFTGRVVSSVAVATIAVLVTRRWPCIGVGRTLASLLARNPSDGLRQSQGPLSTQAMVGTIAAWLALVACLLTVDRWRPIGLVCAPLFGRWAMVVLAFGSRAARSDGKRTKFAKGVTFEEFGWASTCTLALVFWGTGLLGILLLVCAAIPIVGLRVWLHWRLDGITASSMGAACAIAEIVPLLVLASF